MDTTQLTSPPLRPTIRSRDPLALAGGASALATLVAGWWLVHPGRSHFAEEGALLRTWLDAGQTTALLLAVGLLGTILAAAGLRFPSTRHRLGAPAALVAVGGLGLLGMGALSATGYFMALGLPVVATLVLLQVLRRGGPMAGATLIGVGTLMTIGLGSGVLSQESVSGVVGLVPQVLREVPGLAGHYLVLGLLATWVAVALGSADRLAGWTVRHRRVLTILAALGPVPYAATRLSWFTPWPFLAGDGLTPDVRLWGLLLAGCAWVGVVLTLGLIRPWGEIFPGWMPRVGGRPVPVWFAAVPGGLVAAAVTAATVPFLMQGIGEGFAGVAAYSLVMPFWAWGPLLGLAVWGYVLDREQADA